MIYDEQWSIILFSIRIVSQKNKLRKSYNSKTKKKKERKERKKLYFLDIFCGRIFDQRVYFYGAAIILLFWS